MQKPIQKALPQQQPQPQTRLQLRDGGRNGKPSTCPNCNGQKYIRFEVPITDPRWGRAIPCEVCNRVDLSALAGLTQGELAITLDDLETAGRPGTFEMVQAARTLAAEEFQGMLAIYGRYGNGKSTAGKALVNMALARGLQAKYITLGEILAYAREAFSTNAQADSDYGRITTLAKIPLLVIDEVDKARVTEWALELQTHLFEQRYRHADRVATVLIWNGEFEDMSLPWVRSRLSEFCVVRNDDSDMRAAIGQVKKEAQR